MVQSSAEPAQQQQQQQSQAGSSGSAEADELAHARSVGQEFVYIYYMCVNKCPRDLHRFYSTASYFVHGGRELPGQLADPPISGQSAIAAKIGTLEFRDCRTKILMVDSLPAPASGVLIQVCGEISNNAGPMRRFMQTFLLGPIGPKKYFVQNDIFRYQDEVFTDSDAAAAGDTDAADAVDDTADAAGNYGCEATTTAPPNDLADGANDADVGHSAVAENGSDNHEVADDVNNGEEDAETPAADVVNEEPAVENPTASEAAAEQNTCDAEAEEGADDGDESGAAVPETSATQQQQPPPPVTAAPTVSGGGGKKNFAALFGSSSGQQPLQQQQPPPPQARRQPTNATQSNGNHDSPAVPSPAVSNVEQRRERVSEAPDNLQVFVGNLAPEMRDAELADAFRQYGEVTGCRITAGKPRGPGGPVANSFGFVTFASLASVKAAVANPPTLHGNRINVEEKKPGYRRGGGYGGGGGGYGGGGYGGGGYGGGRGGGGRGGGYGGRGGGSSGRGGYSGDQYPQR